MADDDIHRDLMQSTYLLASVLGLIVAVAALALITAALDHRHGLVTAVRSLAARAESWARYGATQAMSAWLALHTALTPPSPAPAAAHHTHRKTTTPGGNR